MSSDRHSFFSLSEDKLYYDEKRKRFVNSDNAPSFAHRQQYQSHFKDVSTTYLSMIEQPPDFRFYQYYSNDPIYTDKRRKSSSLSWSMVSNWSATWTIKPNWRCVVYRDRWAAWPTCTSTHFLMTTWAPMLLIVPESSVPGPGRTLARLLTSSTRTCYSARSSLLTSPFSSTWTWLRKSSRPEKTTSQSTSFTSSASQPKQLNEKQLISLSHC